jgi:gliding motility-associated-like protein
MALDLNAQIVSPLADKVKATSYPVNAGIDPIFIFFSSPGESVSGSLSASAPTSGSFTFDWYRYNTVSGNFDIPVSNYSGGSPSLVNSLGEGGYQVHVYNGSDIDTTFTAWIHIDKLLTSIDKDDAGKLRKSAFTCDYLTLSGAVSLDTFYYFDPVSNEKVRLKNGFTFLWTSDNSDLRIPNAAIILDPNTTYAPPFKNTWYILTAVDSFGMSDVDSVWYESIQVKSDFTFQLIKYEWDPQKGYEKGAYETSSAGYAALEVKFTNKSENGYKYEWLFSADSAEVGFFANEFKNDSSYTDYLYKNPGIYSIGLIATSLAGCIDTLILADSLEVNISDDLTIPNFFSPNGDNINEVFRVYFKSIREFNIRIFNKAGQLVYKAEVTDVINWEGWDGKILNTDREASAGVYYVVIDATGWDGKRYYRIPQYHNVLYLFRGVPK